MHVFGLGEETGVPGGNPRNTGRRCKLHTHMESNPGRWSCEAKVLTTKPPCAWVAGNLEPIPGSIRQGTLWTGCQSITGHNDTHTHTHYGQFRHANQPTMHVFGLGEETEVPGGNPCSTGTTCKLHTHGIKPRTLEL
ncbi:hypothetical protein AMELA_G00088300 [Ameiurus melas]|uniref:Uncharacterized protein n=1 Tax=Ameiurus melas TaxID=219545 RepID=A0A7J6AYY5_AMEME|nr:hypothetical protein AMELA_G00088300 [Ameiurus melas]